MAPTSHRSSKDEAREVRGKERGEVSDSEVNGSWIRHGSAWLKSESLKLQERFSKCMLYAAFLVAFSEVICCRDRDTYSED